MEIMEMMESDLIVYFESIIDKQESILNFLQIIANFLDSIKHLSFLLFFVFVFVFVIYLFYKFLSNFI